MRRFWGGPPAAADSARELEKLLGKRPCAHAYASHVLNYNCQVLNQDCKTSSRRLRFPYCSFATALGVGYILYVAPAGQVRNVLRLRFPTSLGFCWGLLFSCSGRSSSTCQLSALCVEDMGLEMIVRLLASSCFKLSQYRSRHLTNLFHIHELSFS